MTDRCKTETEEKEIDCPSSEDSCKKSAPLPTPDWRKAEDPFKNQKSNKFSTTIMLDEEVKNIGEVDEKKVKAEALLKMLDFYGKDEDNIKSVSYDDLEIEDLYIDPRINDLEIEDLYIDPRIKVRPKVLVSISADKFDKIPETLAEEEEEGSEPSDASESTEEEDTTLSSEDVSLANFVIFQSSDLGEVFQFVTQKMQEIAVQAVKASYEDPNNALTVNFSREAGRLLGFKSALLALIEKNDYTLDDLEGIRIDFGNDGILSVEVGPKASCSKKLTKGFSSFKKKPDVSRQITISLVSRLPSIYEDFKSRKSLNHVSFVNKYMSNVNSAAKNSYFDRASAEDIYPFRKYVSDKFSNSFKKTREQVDEEQRLMRDTQSMRDRYQHLLQEEFPASDLLADSFPEFKKAFGNQADMMFFMSSVVNGLGKRGMGALTRVALNKAQENLDIDLNESIMATSFVENLSNPDLARFIRSIPTQKELQNDIDAYASDILAGIGIENYQIPWQDGYIAGTFDSFNEINRAKRGKPPLTEFERQFSLGTIARGYRHREEQEVFNAYRVSIIENMPPDQILSLAVNFEGPSFVDLLCLRGPPTIGNVANSFLDGLSAELQLPKFNGKIGIPQIDPIAIPDLLGILIEEAVAAALKLILNAILLVIEKILTALGDGVCDAPSNFGIDDVPISNLRTIIKNTIPVQGRNPELVDSYLTTFLKSSGFLGDNSPETRQMVAEFVDDISVTLTENELMLLLKGQSTQEGLTLVSEVAKLRDNFLSQTLTDPNNVADLFSALSNFIPPEFLEPKVAPDLVKPTSIGICKDEGALDRFADLRCSLLRQNKGLTEEECKNHLQTLKNLAKNDVEDLNNIIQNFDNMIGCSLPPIISEPSCPGSDSQEALLPQIPESLKETLNQTMSSYFDNLELSAIEGLIDHQGLLDMILADKLGAGFKQHNNLINGPFGNEAGDPFDGGEDSPQLGLFGLFASSAGKGKSILLDDGSLANFPEEVASNLKDQLETFEEYEQTNYRTITDREVTVFEYEFPQYDGYSFLLADANTSGKEYILKVKEIFGEKTSKASGGPKIEIFEEDNFYVKGSENIDPSLETYLVSQLGVNLESVNAKKDCLANTVINSWKVAEGGSTNVLKDFSEQLYEYFYKKYLNNVCTRITEITEFFDTSGTGTTERSLFKFGFDITAKPKKICLDPEEFGGTKENPPFYFEPPERFGWLNIYDKINPEQDGEEPRRESIISFDDISEKIMENAQSFQDDERLFVNTKKMFIPPFYQIFDKSSKAMIEATLKATTRLYIFDTMMRGINMFGKFKPEFPENFDDVLVAYIAGNIKLGLLEEGKTFFGKKDDGYYLDFLEQTVQSFGNLIDAGLAEPTNEEQIAIDYLNQEQAKLSQCESTKKQNRKIRYEFLRREDIQESANVIFKRYIKEELKKVSESFEKTLNFDSVFVDDLFVQDENWINGNIEIPTDTDTLRNVQNVVKDTSIDGDQDGSDRIKGYYGNPPHLFADDNFDYVPFVLERYVKIEDYNNQEAFGKEIPKVITERAPNLFGVVNVQAWEDFLDSISEVTSGKKITDFWKSWKFGIRISVVPTGDDYDRTTLKDIAKNVPDAECQNHKAFRVGNHSVPLFPLISHEEEIEDTEINTYGGTVLNDEFNKKQRCMLFDFFDSPQYKSIFKYSLSFSRILSMMGIYIMQGFLPSLTVDGQAKWLGPKRGLVSWDRQTMKKAKNQARTMFEAIYNAQDPNYRDKKQKRPTEFFRENNKFSLSQAEVGLRWWERKLQLPRPFDKDGNPEEYKTDCED